MKSCIMFGFRVGNQELLCGVVLGSKCQSPPPTQDWRYAQMHHSCQGKCWQMQNTDCWPGSKFQNLFAFQIITLQNCQYISSEGSHFSGYNVKILILVDVFGFSYLTNLFDTLVADKKDSYLFIHVFRTKRVIYLAQIKQNGRVDAKNTLGCQCFYFF